MDAKAINEFLREETIMPTFVEMDARSTLSVQMEQDVRPVVLINTFTVSADEAPELLKAWAEDAAWMKKQPGFIFNPTSSWHR